jgi:SAM-dependent methyltransferase
MGNDHMEILKRREKEFHDRYYSEGGRSSALKFNAIRRKSRLYFERHLEELCRGKRVLEIGCGEGGLACRLARIAGSVTGIDISEVAVKIADDHAREMALSNVSFFAVDAESIGFDDGSFDVVYGVSILHHLDIATTYRECGRLLGAGGKALFLEPLGHNPLINAYRRLTPAMRTSDEHPLLLKDIICAEESFTAVGGTYFHFLSIGAALLHTTPLFSPAVALLNMFDGALFHTFPFMRKYAWTVVIELTEPRRTQS